MAFFQIRVKIRVSEQSILPFCPTSPSYAALPQLGPPRFSPLLFTVPEGRVHTRLSGAREKIVHLTPDFALAIALLVSQVFIALSWTGFVPCDDMANTGVNTVCHCVTL